MQSSTFTFASADGLEIYVYRWLPDQGTPVRAVVQIAHGMAEHAARYERVAGALTAAGYAVFANDHRGHGHSVRSEAELGHFADAQGWERALEDVFQLNRRIRAEYPDVPLILFGHSMGSFLTQHFLFEHGDAIQAAVLSGSNGKVGPLRTLGAGLAWLESQRVGVRGKSSLLHNMSFGAYNKPFKPARTEFDWLSRDPVEVDKYIADPWCGFMVTTGTWRALLHGLGVIEKPENQARIRKDLPLYIFSGTRDPVGDHSRGVQRLIDAYKRAGLSRVTSRLYQDGRHEMLNETNRDEVVRELIAWLDGVLAELKGAGARSAS